MSMMCRRPPIMDELDDLLLERMKTMPREAVYRLAYDSVDDYWSQLFTRV